MRNRVTNPNVLDRSPRALEGSFMARHGAPFWAAPQHPAGDEPHDCEGARRAPRALKLAKPRHLERRLRRGPARQVRAGVQAAANDSSRTKNGAGCCVVRMPTIAHRPSRLGIARDVQEELTRG